MASVKLQRTKYILCDYVFLNIAWALFTFVRYQALPPHFKVDYSFFDHLMTGRVVLGQVFVPLMMVGLYWLTGYYNNVFFKSRIDELLNTAGVSAAGTVVVFFAILINDAVPERLDNYEIIFMLWALMFVCVYFCRVIITTRANIRVHRREIAFATLVVGVGKNAQALAKRVQEAERGNGFDIVGFVSVDESVASRPDITLPVYRLSQLADVIERHQIKRIIVSPHPGGMRQTGRLINMLLPYDCRLFVTPDLYGLILAKTRFGNVSGEPLIDITTADCTPMTANSKRLADIVISALTVVLLTPVYFVIGLAIKIDSPGPVIYRQQRIGYRKKPFYILKFRSMRVDAETGGPSLSSLNDPRITRLGHYLRKYRIDELPQFINVLRGDMSLVGPRPEREYYIKRIVELAPYYTLLHQVRPGITSWGMVKYGYATSVDQMIDRLRYDLIYLDNISVLVDLKILFYTVNTVLTGRGL